MATLCAASAANAQTAENVLLVINERSAASRQVGEYYAKKRSVPDAQVVRIQTTEEETISRAGFIATIHTPITAAIAGRSLHDRILYIVLTKGVPLRIQGTLGIEGTMASVDSELTLLYQRALGSEPPVRGRTDNPYYLGARDIREARPFTHREQNVYLITRLDGFTVSDAIALVDRGLSPTADGRIVLDQRAALTNRMPEDWLAEAATRLITQGHGDRVLLESTPKPVRDVAPVIGYYSWGSVDPQNRVRATKLGFANGAIAATFAGADARTFREPPAGWLPSSTAGPANRYAGAPHSLIGDLIREGVTGVSGAVAEPYVQSVVRPEILFSAYLAGFNLAEAFYLALPHLSWHTIVVGDPLCTPFPRKGPAAADLKPDLDETTELPQFFSARRLKVAGAKVRTKPEALQHLVRGESRLARNLLEEARASLDQAVAVDDTLTVAHMQLALLDEQAKRREAAIARYQRIIELEPNNALALNNLAYALSVHRGRPAEAKPFAERAVAAAPRDPLVADTLGWIEHLLGNHQLAVKLLSAAGRAVPGNAEVRLHTAFAVAAAGAPGAAAAELEAALKLDPQLAERQEVRDLKSRLDLALKNK